MKKYLRELSIIIVGIGLTLIASEMINSLNERNNMKRELAMIRVELQENLNTVERNQQYFIQTAKLADYAHTLQNELDISLLPTDTLTKYKTILSMVLSFTYRKEAFEMLKYSGSMRLIDKDELLQMMECYRLLEITTEQSEKYMDSKTNLMLTSFTNFNLDSKNQKLKQEEQDYEDYQLLYVFTTQYKGMDMLYSDCKNVLNSYLDQ